MTGATILADLTARLTALTIGADSRLWFIVSPKLYKTVSLVQGTGGFLMQDDKIGMISVAPSDALTTTAFLIDAKGIAAELDTVKVGQLRQGIVATRQRPDQWQLSVGKSVSKQLHCVAMRDQVRCACIEKHERDDADWLCVIMLNARGGVDHRRAVRATTARAPIRALLADLCVW